MTRRAIFLMIALCALMPGVAQTQGTSAFLAVSAISPFVNASTPLRLQADVTNTGLDPIQNATIGTTVFGRTLSRSQLRSFLDGGPSGGIVGATSKKVPAVAAGETARISVKRAIQSFAPSMRRTGVYPVEIRLGGVTPPVVLRTAIPSFGSQPEEPINVALVLPVSAPYVTEPDGTYTAEGLERLDIAGLLGKLDALADPSDLPITLALDPSTLATLRDLADGYRLTDGTVVTPSQVIPEAARAALRAARLASAAAEELASVPYAPIDAPTVVQRMSPGELVRHVTVGRAETRAIVGRSPAGELLAPRGGRLDTASLDALRAPGVRTILLDRTAVVSASEPFQPQLFGPSRPVRIAGAGNEVTALLTDPDLGGRLTSIGDPVMAAQSFLAETAAAWLELPLFGSDRVLAVLTSSLPAAATITALVRGFDTAPWAKLGSPIALAEALPPQGAAVRFRPTTILGPGAMLEANTARNFYTSLQRIAPDLPPSLDRLGELVLVAASEEWAIDATRGRALASHVSEQVQTAFSNIRLAKRSQVTLTARTGEIPITVVNDNDFPVSVRVNLASLKVSFNNGSTRTRDLLASRADTMGFPVEVLATGSFPITVRIETPDGKRLIASNELVLRSTAASAVTLALVGGSILVLIAASIRRGVRRRGAASTDATR